jgi:glycosyltransferase involved in cell wall biosynthesis
MRILMLAPGDWIHTKRTVNCLLDSGHEITFIDGDNPLPEGRAGFTFLPYPRSGSRFYKKVVGNDLANRISERLVVAQFRSLWKQLKPDVVHVCWLDKRAYLCARAGMKPLMLSVWGSDLNSQFLSGASLDEASMAAQALNSADVTIVDAPDMHEKCSRLAGKHIRTEEVHLGADTRLFRPDKNAAEAWRKRLGIPAGSKVLISIRAMALRYGHHLILQAFATAVPQLKNNAFLVFKDYKGSGPTYASELRALATQYGVDEYIRWIGEVSQSEMPQLYALSEAIINLPTMDAFPVTFVEAAACERMVISCKLPSYLGTFAEKYFHLIDPDNPEALADAIVALVNETPAERKQRLSKLAELRCLILKEYDETLYSRRLSELYEEVAANRRTLLAHVGAFIVLCLTLVIPPILVF